MAEAKRVTPKPVDEVHLRLTQPEAQVLLDILCLIGGDPEDTRRGLVDNIRYALHKDAKIPYPKHGGPGDMTGSVSCLETSVDSEYEPDVDYD